MNELEGLLASIKSLVDIEDDAFTDEVMEQLLAFTEQQFTPELRNQVINQVINNLEDQELSKEEARESAKQLADLIKEMAYGEMQYTGNKKQFVDATIQRTIDLINEAVEKYHSYNFELPMTVDTADGAKVPTYAHDTDAAADLYAMEDVIIPAHSYGNKLRTGVKIQLPEGWLAFIMPRSSIGAKTPLRLSNSVGLIDSGYRGELGILYDNTSDQDYHVNQGDRIAQLLVMPNYRFKAKVVDILADSDRGEGGFGSSGT